MDHMNDTETYIYSASQLASVGDISGLKVGYADFSKATKLQSLKIGDASPSYNNGNLETLNLGNNTLLSTIDVRNCSRLSTPVDLSGCIGLEEVYFDGTQISGVSLPNGGIIKKLHLPSTITNLTILNQTQISEFVCPDFSNITTLRIENPSSSINVLDIINHMASGSRVRLYNFNWSFSQATEIISIFDKLDTMRGLDQNNNTVDKAQVYGTIYVPSITGAQLREIQDRYPLITVTYSSIVSHLYYWNFEGTQLIYDEIITNGQNGVYIGQPSHANTNQYQFIAFVGWSLQPESSRNDQNCRKNVTADRNVYAAYVVTLTEHTATFRLRSEDGGTELYVQTNVPYGTTPQYNGPTPVSSRGFEKYGFNGTWTPELSGITQNTVYYANFDFIGSLARALIEKDQTFEEFSNDRYTYIGKYAFAGGGIRSFKNYSLPEVIELGDYQFYNASEIRTIDAPKVSVVRDYALHGISSINNTTIDLSKLTYIGSYGLYSSWITSIENHILTTLGNYALSNCRWLTSVTLTNITELPPNCFYNCQALTTINIPLVTTLKYSCFARCSSLSSVSLPAVTTVAGYVFDDCTSLEAISFENVTVVQAYAFQDCPNLTSVNLPNAESFDIDAFSGCTSLEVLDLPKCQSINNRTFHNIPNLRYLILRKSDSLVTLRNNVYPTGDFFESTFLIYVPDNLVEQYKSATVWCDISDRIKGISELPSQ